MKTALLTLLAFLTATSFAEAADKSAVQCHCFRQRTYNSVQPFSGDPYLLTSSYNSFLASMFKVSKRDIVMKKMKGGVGGDDLLIGLFLARELGTELDLLLAIIDNGGSWPEILASETGRQKIAEAPNLAAIAKYKSTDELASEISSQLISQSFELDKNDVSSLKGKGLNLKEIVLLNTMARLRPKYSSQDLLQVKNDKQMSWGQLASTVGLAAEKTGQFLLEE
ncbi:MAG: hypothetical protein ABFS19_10830 [Thermodesulfobacteriota bacterium]